LQLLIGDGLSRRTHAFDTLGHTVVRSRQSSLYSFSFGFHLLKIGRPFDFQRRYDRRRCHRGGGCRLGRNCDRPFSHGRYGKHRRLHNNRGSFRNCDRRWGRNNSHSLIRHHRRYSLNRFTDNFFSRCRSNSQRVGNDAAGFRIRHKWSAGIPDAVATLLLTLAFLTRFARALTTIRAATTTATTTTAAAFFAALLLGTLRYRYCIGQIGLIQFSDFRSGRCALLLARFLRTILAGATVTTATLPVFTIALAAFALTTRTALTATTAFASFTTLTATAAA
jgi:hypothetical protein